MHQSTIIEVDRGTGEVVWDKKIGDYTYAETFTIMPLAVNNKIVFGTAGAEYGVRGWVASSVVDILNFSTASEISKAVTIPAAPALHQHWGSSKNRKHDPDYPRSS